MKILINVICSFYYWLIIIYLILEGKVLKDDEILGSLGLLGKKGILYFKDFGL